MAAPAFAVVGRGEKVVDQAGPGIGGFAADEGVDFGGRGGEADEIQIGTADEGGAVGAGGGFEAFLREADVEERVNGGRRMGDGLECPPFLVGVAERRFCGDHRLLGEEGAVRVFGPGVDPIGEQLYFCFRQ